MLSVIFKKEVRAILRTKQFTVVGLLLFLLFALALYNSVSSFKRQEQNRKLAQETAYNAWINQGPENAHNASHFGTFAYKPSSVLSIIDPGINTYTGTQVRIEAHKQNDALFSVAEDDDSGSRFGNFTIALVLQLLVPLCIILFCFSAISKEKEEATIKLVAGQGVSLQLLVWGKIAAYYAMVLALIIPLVAATVIVLYSISGSSVAERLFPLFISYAGYYFIMVSITVLVSAGNKKSKNALLLMLSFWIISSILVPKITANIGSNLYPLTSKIAFNNAIEEQYGCQIRRR